MQRRGFFRSLAGAIAACTTSTPALPAPVAAPAPSAASLGWSAGSIVGGHWDATTPARVYGCVRAQLAPDWECELVRVSDDGLTKMTRVWKDGELVGQWPSWIDDAAVRRPECQRTPTAIADRTGWLKRVNVCAEIRSP